MLDNGILKRTENTILAMREQSDIAILFFSATGKDSIALVDMLAPRFKTLVCVHLYMVKGLELVKPFLAWAEGYGNVIIEQLPHPDLIEARRSGLFTVKPLINDNVKRYKFVDYENLMKAKYHTDVVAYGMKAADSFVRQGMFAKAKKADIHYDYNKYYPIVNWKNKDVLAYITMHNLPKPLKLGSNKASSGIGLLPECIEYLRDKHPRDYMKFVEAFPLLEAKYGLPA